MLLLYSHTISPRLQYIVDFFSNELFDKPIRITTEALEYSNYDGPRMNYSAESFSYDTFFIGSTPLLFENDIKPRSIDCFDLNFHKAFFKQAAISPSIFLLPPFIC